MKSDTIKRRLQELKNRFLQGTEHHYQCQMPDNPGIFLGFILRRLYGRIAFSQDQVKLLEALPKDAMTVYVNKQKSTFEFLFSYTRFNRMGLTAPTIAINYQFLGLQPFTKIMRMVYLGLSRLFNRHPEPDVYQDGYLKGQMTAGQSVFLSLVEKHDFYQRFVRQRTDPLRYLVEYQKETQRPIFIIPQLVFYSEKPGKTALSLTNKIFGYDQNPAILRKIMKSLVRPEKMFVELSKPLNLKAWLKENEALSMGSGHLALILRRDLLSQITRHKQSTTGPVLKSHDEIKQNVLTNEDLQSYMKKYAARKNISLYRARQEAIKYFDEIAAKYSPRFVALSIGIIQWLSLTIFEGIRIDKERFDSIKQMSLNGPVVFVPCHRSHIDSMVMLYVMFQNHMSPPHFFAGKNLSFWPLGTVLRKAGAFFVRRSFQGAVFYTKVFAAYIHKLLEEGFHITVFIEGTRSRSGKLLQPQLGMINILLNAYQNGACRDLIFVPVYIGYDRVPEEGDYVHEIKGGKKAPESARQFLQIGKLLEKRFGKIYVKFDEPIALKDHLKQAGLSADELSSKDKNRVCRQLGYGIMAAIDQSTIVSPRALAAGALLNSKKPIRTYEHFLDQAMSYLFFLKSRRAPLSEPLLLHPERALAQVMNIFVQGKIIEAVQQQPGHWQTGDKFKMVKGKRLVLDYYKNNGITHFLPAAFTSLSILALDSFFFRTDDIIPHYLFLKDLFSLEFMQNKKKTLEYDMRKTIKTFIDSEYLVPHPTLPDTYTITSPNYRRLKQFAAFIKPFVESYRIVLSWYSQQKKEVKSGKVDVKKILAMGEQMYEHREIDRMEAVSRLNIENAVQYYSKKGLRSKEDKELIHHYEERLDLYRNELDR